MTAEREAMTLEEAKRALSLEIEFRETGGYDGRPLSEHDMRRTIDAIDAYLSRAAEPVGELVRLGSSPYTGEYGSVFWRDNTPPPCGTKLYTHPSEDARDALSRLLLPGLRVYAGDYVVQIDAGKLGLFTERFTDEKDKPRAIQAVQQRAIDAAMKESGNAT